MHITQLLCEFHSYTLNLILDCSNFHLQKQIELFYNPDKVIEGQEFSENSLNFYFLS